MINSDDYFSFFTWSEPTSDEDKLRLDKILDKLSAVGITYKEYILHENSWTGGVDLHINPVFDMEKDAVTIDKELNDLIAQLNKALDNKREVEKANNNIDTHDGKMYKALKEVEGVLKKEEEGEEDGV